AIECAVFWIVAKTHRAVLVRNSSKWNPLTEEQIASEKTFVTLVPVDWAFRLLLHQALKFLDQTLVTLFVIWLVLQHDLAVAIDRYAIVRVRQVLRRQPEIQRVFAHKIQRPFWRDLWSAGFERVAVELADE